MLATPRRLLPVALAATLALAVACTTDGPLTAPDGPRGLIENGWTRYAGMLGCMLPATGGTCSFNGDSTMTSVSPALYRDSALGTPYWFYTTSPTRTPSWYVANGAEPPATGPITLTIAPGARAVRVDIKLIPQIGDQPLAEDLPSAARIIAEELDGDVATFDIPLTRAACQSLVNPCQASRTLSSTDGFRRVTLEQSTSYHIGFNFTVSAASASPPAPPAQLGLTCRNVTTPGAAIRRGDEIECAIADGNHVTAWRFLPDDARFAVVLDSTSERTWRGRAVTSGTVRAYGWATVAQVGLTPRDSASAPVVVGARQWTPYSFLGPVDAGQDSLPNPPRKLGDLGKQTYDTTLSHEYPTRIELLTSGPNAGFAWVNAPLPRRAIHVYINNAALDTASTWWKSQRGGTFTELDPRTRQLLQYHYCGQSGRWFMPLDSLRQQVRWHEGIDVPPAPFVSHVQVIERTIQRHDLNADAEPMLAQFDPGQPGTNPRQVVLDSLAANARRFLAAADSLHQSQVHTAPTNAYRPVCAYRY